MYVYTYKKTWSNTVDGDISLNVKKKLHLVTLFNKTTWNYLELQIIHVDKVTSLSMQYGPICERLSLYSSKE